MLRREVTRKLCAVVALALLATACSGGDDGIDSGRVGVGVRALPTDVGLGLDKGLEAAPAQMLGPSQGGFSPLPARPEAFTLDASGGPGSIVVADSTPTCPPPRLLDNPDVAAPVDPVGRPAEGVYLWQVEAELREDDHVLQTSGLEARTLGFVEDHPDFEDAFRYTVIQRALDARGSVSVTTTYLVIPESPVGQAADVSTDVGQGLYIESIQSAAVVDGQPEVTWFRPQPPVQLLAFPVENGALIESTGVDPISLARLTVEGTVLNHTEVETEEGKVERKDMRTIDVCGGRIDSWYVQATMTFQITRGIMEDLNPIVYQFPDPRNARTEVVTTHYNYNVATQFGGLVVGEHIEPPDDADVDWVYQARIGTIEPSPLSGGGSEEP